VAFILRHVEKLELEQIADACEISLATVKRRLQRAQQRFARAAARDDALRGWLEEGGRWSS
jgi:RNA polymerase sigma-70 factor, ECF subfamily